MGRLFRCIAFALVLANAPAIAPVRAAEPVDLLLVLACLLYTSDAADD